MKETVDFTLEDMRAGAEVAVRICMAVQPGERVLILGDQGSALISQALADAASPIAGSVETHTLESLGPRPITDIPDRLRKALDRFQPHVSFYTASSRPGELRFRMAYMPAVMQANPDGARHGHMINITPPLMMQGMRVDYQRIYAVTMRVHELVSCAEEIRVTNPKGTDFSATLNPDFNWIPCHGLYHEPGKWGNLPEGETFTSPGNANGILVVDELGDYFSERYGILETPVSFEVEDGLVKSVQCEDKSLEKDVQTYIFGAENADRVGEFAIGTNIALTGLVGNLLQDEKFPGVHVAFGDPYGKQTGADWKSDHHVDVIPTQCTIDVDGKRIMSDGEFIAEILGD
ncbi:MAG: aminopeptidase [Caldilineaceae bacterium]|nr:aminopeptidase [Caldilineaceae bacterium]